VIVDNALYRDGGRVPVGADITDLRSVRDAAAGEHDFVWVGLHDPDEEELAQLEEVYGIHPLALEDAFTAHQRP
jgi:magnesium transporter